MPRIKRHTQKNDNYSALVELQLLAQTKLTVAKVHESGEVLLEAMTEKFVKGSYFATRVMISLALTKAEAQELFAALGYVLKSKPQTAKPSASRRPKPRD